mmetsp:Transcript_757/g.2217  ORF Transcript_757/g.2217 Transcript_757/m.2217 type:complete len:214 (-) Transcript_757:422-1063(-)
MVRRRSHQLEAPRSSGQLEARLPLRVLEHRLQAVDQQDGVVEHLGHVLVSHAVREHLPKRLDPPPDLVPALLLRLRRGRRPALGHPQHALAGHAPARLPLARARPVPLLLLLGPRGVEHRLDVHRVVPARVQHHRHRARRGRRHLHPRVLRLPAARPWRGRRVRLGRRRPLGRRVLGLGRGKLRRRRRCLGVRPDRARSGLAQLVLQRAHLTG